MTKNELETWCPALERLFGYGLPDGAEDLHTVGSDRSGFTYREGVPAMYMSRTGKKVVRADVNGIVRMASQSGYFNASGGYYTFDSAVASAIGGYPYGAILRWRDPASGAIRIVRSLKPDNAADFVADPNLIDGENWAFADDFAPSSCRPRVYPQWDMAETIESFSIGETYTARRPGVLYIQGGASENESVAEGNSEILVWANVREAGASDFHAGGLLAYIPPVNAGYQSTSQSAQLVDPRITQNIGYTSLYAPGYVALYLMPGDTVNLSANLELDYHSRMVFVPLLSADEMDARSGGSDFPEGGGGTDPEPPQPGPEPVIVTVPHAMRVVSASEVASNVELADQTTHFVSLVTSVDAVRFTLPARAENIAREFEIVLDIGTGVTPPSLVFLPRGGEVVAMSPVDGNVSVFVPEAGMNIYKFREIDTGSFLVSRSVAD